MTWERNQDRLAPHLRKTFVLTMLSATVSHEYKTSLRKQNFLPYSFHSLPISWRSAGTALHEAYQVLQTQPRIQRHVKNNSRKNTCLSKISLHINFLKLWRGSTKYTLQHTYYNKAVTGPQLLMPTYHWSWIVCKGSIKCFDVFELKHVSLHKCLPDFLISPCDEELIIVISLLCQSSGKINWSFQVHSFPGERRDPDTGEDQISILALCAQSPRTSVVSKDFWAQHTLRKPPVNILAILDHYAFTLVLPETFPYDAYKKLNAFFFILLSSLPHKNSFTMWQRCHQTI